MIRKRLDASQEDFLAWKLTLKALVPKMLDRCQNQSNVQANKNDGNDTNDPSPESGGASDSQSDYKGSDDDNKQVPDLTKILLLNELLDEV